MHDAFKPSPQESPRRKRLWEYITRPSRTEQRDAENVLGQARAFVDWSSMPYFDVWIKWLESEASKPVEGTAHMDLLVGTTRANTFKEILHKLRELRVRADMALGENDGD